ncbi:hypothetical protein HDK90DRAFT_406039 [Phyllosticta capitalensis]|uniref:DUF3074 domain-containing protein n=1 Tax=Phyllosticta capitalensis TaxID=121624 RepID=A0ABR1Z1H0_9PEZI
MSTLHDALKWLRPKPFSEVPLEDLGTWMSDVFAQSEVAVNSVPHPPGGTDFASSKRSRNDANGATCAAEMTVSEARPPPVDPAHEELKKSWGKPLKVGDNPLGITVYKMAGADRHGSWFARKSIHEGLGFTKWKKAIQREFAESLAVEGGPGSGCVRGIGGDRRLEQRTVEGVGEMEVLQLSAQFPGPTSPREFITLLLTSDNALTEKSKPHMTPLDEALNQVPRHYMVVSIPTEHPEAPPRDSQGLVMGQYESIEMIREIPLRKDSASEDDPETNPVEWIMITRSDPGGGIPRFMVDRGTPGSIVADTKKFLDWACARDHVPDPEEGIDPDEVAALTSGTGNEKGEIYDAAAGNAHGAGVGTSIADRPQSIPHTRTTSAESSTGSRNSGLVSGLTTALGNGIQSYAPQSVASYLQPSPQPVSPASTESTESETSSLHSFTSAQQWTTATEHGSKKAPLERLDPGTANNSSSSLGASSSKSATPSSQKTPYDKELAKLDSKRAALEAKLQRAREKEASRSEANTAREEREKKKAQEKYEKEVAKLAAKREKEQKKMLDRRRKDEGKRDADRFKRERDEAKARADVAEMEVKLLRDQVRELQKENTVLVQAMGRSEEGRAVLKNVADEIGAGSDAGSAKSRASR